jgi:hypothetical protein
MNKYLIAASLVFLAACSANEPVSIMRMKDPNTPYKGFILKEIYKEADGSGLVIFETCAGNLWQLPISDLTYEGSFPSVECASLARRGGSTK